MNLDNVPKFCTKCGERLRLLLVQPKYDSYTGRKNAGSFVVQCPNYFYSEIVEGCDTVVIPVKENIPFQEAQKRIVEVFGSEMQ